MPNRKLSEEIKLVDNNIERKGGRPPKDHVKEGLIIVMNSLKGADLNLIKKAYYQKFNDRPDNKTLKKYLDVLANEGFLKKEIIRDNAEKVKKGLSKQRRQLFLYEIVG